MNIMINVVKRGSALVAGGALVLACSACSPAEEGLSIVTSAYPFAFAAERVAGGHAEITNLLPAGGDAHGIELTPRQVESIAGADLMVFQTGFQPPVDDAVAQQNPANTIDTATFLELHEAGHDHEAEEGAQHDHGIHDPHTWLDPMNVAVIGTHIADELAKIDPEHADDYRTNATALSDEMSSLDNDFATGLASCQLDTFIVNHEAFGYLADKYGLHQEGIVGLSTEEEPSPARIAQVQQIASEHGVNTIFYEHAVSPAVAEAIASDLGLTTDVLDPVATLSSESRGADYTEVMRANLESLRKANICS